MATVRYCAWSRENASQNKGYYCKYNENGRCTLSEISISAYVYEDIPQPRCENFVAETVPFEYQRYGRPRIADILKRFIG